MRLTLTARAAQAVLARANEADVAGWPLRVAAVAGGCNGLVYDLYFVEAPGAEDEVIDAEPLRVVVDPTSARLIDGAEIDYAGGASFQFHNPRARKACSCGASFEV